MVHFPAQVPAATPPSHAALETPTSDSPWVRQEPSLAVPMKDILIRKMDTERLIWMKMAVHLNEVLGNISE